MTITSYPMKEIFDVPLKKSTNVIKTFTTDKTKKKLEPNLVKDSSNFTGWIRNTDHQP